jgi:hypothetical protein
VKETDRRMRNANVSIVACCGMHLVVLTRDVVGAQLTMGNSSHRKAETLLPLPSGVTTRPLWRIRTA